MIKTDSQTIQKDAAKTNRSIIVKSLITAAIAALIVALGLGFYFNRQKIFDFIAANTYTASKEISEVESKINLTGDAKIIFYATHPSLENQEQFNKSCDSHDEEISVLGCYTGGKIYIYNIEYSELNGIIESTAAHELLHAVWERMSPDDKTAVATALVEVYNDDRYHALLAEDLGSYTAQSDLVDELHSRVGTEIADLPEALESHYAKYFKNQDLVVDFYSNYITPFQELSEEIENLAAKLEELNATIDQKTAEYHKFAEDLSAKIDEFNNCLNTAGCFTTEALFYARRNTLLGEQAQLNDLYEAVNQLVNEYNSIVKEYNESVIRGERLEQIINSNKVVETIN